MARRQYTDFIVGTITDDPLTNVATTINAAILASVPAVAGNWELIPLVLDPEAAGNGPEIVHVTAHTASATSATILRGQEGTSGVQHEAGTIVQQAWTADDVADVKTKFILVWSAGKGEAEVLDTPAEAFRWKVPWPCTLISATPTAGIAPTGDSIDFEAANNGSSMFSTKPTIAATVKDGVKQAPSANYAFDTGDIVTAYITQVGSTTPGENVAIAFEIEVP